MSTPSQQVHVTKAHDVDNNTAQSKGMIRKAAIVGKSDKVCASVMTAKPHSASDIHHHGDQAKLTPKLASPDLQDTIVYAASGRGSILFGPSGSQRQDLSPGDFALIPAFCEHQEVNEGEEEVTWIITRSGGTPKVVNLEGWGGKAVEE